MVHDRRHRTQEELEEHYVTRTEMVLKYLDQALEAEEHMFFLAFEIGRLSQREPEPLTSREIAAVVAQVLREARGIRPKVAHGEPPAGDAGVEPEGPEMLARVG